MPTDDLTQTRLDVAEMKGMLTQVVNNHQASIERHDRILDVHEIRLNEKAKTIARHDERINDLEDDSNARQGKIFGVIGASVGLIGLGLAIFNRLTIGA